MSRHPSDTGAEGGQPNPDPMHRFIHRHPSVQEKMRWLLPNPRLDGIAADIAMLFWQHGVDLTDILDDGSQLTLGLQHLIDGKDCCVRQALTDSGAA